MEDLRTLLKDANLADESKELFDRLVEAACAALDGGGDADAISRAVAAEVTSTLGEAESTLTNAETIIREGT